MSETVSAPAPQMTVIANATECQIRTVSLGGIGVAVNIPPMQILNASAHLSLSMDQTGPLTNRGLIAATFDDGTEVKANFDATNYPSIFWIFLNAIVTSSQQGQFTGLTFSR